MREEAESNRISLPVANNNAGSNDAGEKHDRQENQPSRCERKQEARLARQRRSTSSLPLLPSNQPHQLPHSLFLSLSLLHESSSLNCLRLCRLSSRAPQSRKTNGAATASRRQSPERQKLSKCEERSHAGSAETGGG